MDRAEKEKLVEQLQRAENASRIIEVKQSNSIHQRPSYDEVAPPRRSVFGVLLLLIARYCYKKIASELISIAGKKGIDMSLNPVSLIYYGPKYFRDSYTIGANYPSYCLFLGLGLLLSVSAIIIVIKAICRNAKAKSEYKKELRKNKADIASCKKKYGRDMEVLPSKYRTAEAYRFVREAILYKNVDDLDEAIALYEADREERSRKLLEQMANTRITYEKPSKRFSFGENEHSTWGWDDDDYYQPSNSWEDEQREAAIIADDDDYYHDEVLHDW